LTISYRYKGLRADGGEVEGRISAADENDAVSQLTARKVTPFELIPDADARRYERRKARPVDRSRFLRQLSTLARAGAPLLTCFDSLIEDEPCREIAEQARLVRADLRGGSRLSAALTRRMPDLPDYAPRLVELGEATGSLPERLTEVSKQMEADLAASAEIRNALAYPAFLAVAGTVAVFFIFIAVVPRFSALLANSRGDIPALSRIVLSIGEFAGANAVPVMISMILVIALAIRLVSAPATRRQLTGIAFRMPVIGRFLSAADSARWARVAGTALAAGAGLIDALTLAEKGVLSPRRKAGLAEVRRAVRAGAMLEQALRAHTDMDTMTINLVRTGRLSGDLAGILLFVAETGEADARNLAKRVTALAEPLAVAFLAGIIGLVVVSLVLAMSSLYDFDIG
jgi:general secretion pathway protein F